MAWLTTYSDANLVVDESQSVNTPFSTYDADDKTFTLHAETYTTTQKRYVGMDYDTALGCKADLIAAGYGNVTLRSENNGGGYTVSFTQYSGVAWA